jgi:transporter family protein
VNYLILAVGSAVFFAMANVLDKYLISGWSMKPVTFAVIVAVLESFVLILIPLRGLTLPSIGLILLAFLIGLIFVVGVITYAKAMSFEEASRVVPLQEVIPIFVLILSFFVLHETISSREVLGVSLLVAGALIISTRRVEGVLRLSRALYFMLLTGFLIAVSTVLSKFLYSNIAVLDGFLWVKIGSLLAGLAFLFVPNFRSEAVATWQSLSFRTRGVFFLNEFITVVALVMYAVALSLGPSPVVSALNGFQPFFLFLFVIILSTRFPKILKEEVSASIIATKSAALMLMFAGLWLVHV